VTSYVIDSTVDDSLGIFTGILRDSALLSINKRDLSNSVGAVVKHHSINSNEVIIRVHIHGSTTWDVVRMNAVAHTGALEMASLSGLIQ
jgi:hypothetical protein